MSPTGRAAGSVFIIDDDLSVRTALERLLTSAGVRSRTFRSATDFLSAGCLNDGDCIITDVRMHGISGLELQAELQRAGRRASFIFVTASDAEDARAQAKSAGAVAYFRKPVDDQALIDAIEWALSRGVPG